MRQRCLQPTPLMAMIAQLLPCATPFTAAGPSCQRYALAGGDTVYLLVFGMLPCSAGLHGGMLLCATAGCVRS